MYEEKASETVFLWLFKKIKSIFFMKMAIKVSYRKLFVGVGKLTTEAASSEYDKLQDNSSISQKKKEDPR